MNRINRLFTPWVAAGYYGAIIGLLLLWSDGNIPGILRYPFALLPFLPAILVDKKWFLPALMGALSVSLPGVQYDFNWLFHLAVILIVVVYYGIRDRKIISPLEMIPFLLALLYVIVVNLATGNEIGQSHQQLCIAICAMFALRPVSETSDCPVSWCAYALVIASVINSAVYWLNFDIFAIDYGKDFVRSYIGDPNYESSSIGTGAVVAIYLLLNGKAPLLWQKLLCAMGFAFSFITMFSLASRGAILAFVMALVLLVMFSHANKWIKALAVVSGVGLLAFAYSQHYMDLMIARFYESSLQTGTGRFRIWSDKMTSFAQDENLLHWLLGVGRDAALHIGKNGSGGAIYTGWVAFHNQFLATLVNYGLIGFCGFLWLLYLPIRKAPKGNKGVTMALMVYLAAVSMSLDPFTYGFPSFFFYYLFVYIQATRETI